MQKTLWIAVLAGLATQVQAQVAPMEAPLLASYAGKNLALSTQAAPKMLVYTLAQASGGMAGAIPGLGVLGAAVAGGIAGAATSGAQSKSDLITKASFADPALGIAQALAAELKSRMDLQVLPPAGTPKDNTVESLIAAAPGADLMLEVNTQSWTMVYFPTDWSHYRITYRGSLRVVDVANKRILGESVCQSKYGETRRPSLEQLTTRDASLLRFYFQQAQFDCADQFAVKVLGLPPLPRPADALTDYRDDLSTDDETAVPDLPKAGQDDYKAWLAMSGPKAFAIGDTIRWGWGVGMKPADPAAPIDVALRALHNCKRSYKQNCKLYAVNGKVVEGSDYAQRMQALFEKGSTAHKAATQDEPGSLAPTGFAKVTEFDLVPYLSDKGRAAYKAWLSKPSPKAFSISAAGHHGEGVGTKPADTTMPTDPIARSLAYCNKSSPLPCKTYAVNGDVVFTLEW